MHFETVPYVLSYTTVFIPTKSGMPVSLTFHASGIVYTCLDLTWPENISSPPLHYKQGNGSPMSISWRTNHLDRRSTIGTWQC